MSSQRAVLGALVAVVLAACSAGPATQPTTIAQVTRPPATAVPAVTAEPPTEPSTPKATPAPTPKPTPKPTPVPVPPKPSGVTFGEHERDINDGNDTEITYTVTWRAPRTKGVEIRVYGVLECLSMPKDPSASSHGPCLVEHTTLPASEKVLIAKVPASDAVTSWKAHGSWGGCDIAEVTLGPRAEAFYAIVLAAYNGSGPSVFAIAEPGQWWQPDPGDTAC